MYAREPAVFFCICAFPSLPAHFRTRMRIRRKIRLARETMHALALVQYSRNAIARYDNKLAKNLKVLSQ